MITSINDMNMEKEFIRVRSVKDIIISITLLAAGCALVMVPAGAGVNVLGFFLIFAGILFGLILRTGYKDVQTGGIYLKKEHFFQQAMNQVISSAIASRPDSLDLSERDKGNAVRLDVYFSKKTGKAYLQLFEYVPYKYEPCSKMFEHEIDNVGNLI